MDKRRLHHTNFVVRAPSRTPNPGIRNPEPFTSAGGAPMILVNENYSLLQSSYLFAEIARRIRE